MDIAETDSGLSFGPGRRALHSAISSVACAVLEEALTHGADPLHLALVFGIDEKTAVRYAGSARALLGQTAEHSPSPSTKELGPD
ncbi:hypothetical protein [Streptomyces sp. NBC_01314]|uniref:hypothetical protein n=1 Tax=Streptomyces sp. NBC_01314 TaxID=2903821 RepID=UPI0030883D9B|nr:hypothetical protein OG622_46495 [Streptomyces sp. NBC_01314]